MARWIAFAGLLMLISCAPGNDRFTLPTPNIKAVKQRAIQVRVDLVQGPALPMAKLLSQSVAAGLNDQGVVAAVGGNDAVAYVLQGRAEANWAEAQVPFVMLIYWTLSDRAGTQIGAYTQGVRGERWKWEYGDPRIIRAVGSGAAKPVSSMIIGKQKTTLPFLLIGAGILVRPVSGSPGGDNQVLTRAMKSALNAADVLITEDIRQASVMLDGAVNTRFLADGRARVTIIWTVSSLDGFEVGRAIQDNAVPAATLRESWATEAPKIARAALDGIERILRTGNSRSSPTPGSGSGGSATPSNIRQFPGRAPPPPE
ncbi:MAG TPA: hypothetical protein ENI69_02130 [Rhodospirillales bacterium]|nr:hypothetical protein [Rhodospirillales bacterium]